MHHWPMPSNVGESQETRPGLTRQRAKRAIIASQRTLRFVRLVQIAFVFAQARFSSRKERWFGIRIEMLSLPIEPANEDTSGS